MISSSSSSMISALAGLQRLESQIYQAMLEVNPAEAAKSQPQAHAPSDQTLVSNANIMIATVPENGSLNITA